MFDPLSMPPSSDSTSVSVDGGPVNRKRLSPIRDHFPPSRKPVIRPSSKMVRLIVLLYTQQPVIPRAAAGGDGAAVDRDPSRGGTSCERCGPDSHAAWKHVSTDF